MSSQDPSPSMPPITPAQPDMATVQAETTEAKLEEVKEEPKVDEAQPSIEQTDAPDPVAPPKSVAGLSKPQREAIERILQILVRYEEDERDIGSPFARLVPKRTIPEYYDVIKEPVAFSTIRQKMSRKQYKNFKEVTRDFALIAHNAQVFNKPSSLIAQDAITIGKIAKTELDKLVEQGLIAAHDAEFPYLGEIPEHEDTGTPVDVEEEEDEEEAEEEEEDDDDEEEDVTDDDRPRRKGKRGARRSSATAAKKTEDVGKEDPEAMKKRGRPPKVHTPMEARINNLLKSLRKFKTPKGELMILPFERLPDKTVNPDYYQDIKNPIAMDLIKRKAKRKKYQSVDHVLGDLNLLFENAKKYNIESSSLYKDAVELQQQAQVLAAEEKKKPDSDFVDEDGRLPVPEILHNGEIYKVGDWIHLENGNDVTKPIVAQIYRTWQDPEGQKWINACWYYRPEQTVHRYEKHFLENEVVKTGQYRDHKIEEITDRCFVMFFTRYFKGRPRGLDPEKEVYVCEARYNEEKFKLNKIKTWASCVPDEVRDKDYEMDLFDSPRKMKKVPSPIKHLLREDAKEDDPLPKPTWGVPNAPPIVGAVHKRPREANESPPPEPTPSPPPPTPQPARRTASTAYDASGDVRISGVQPVAPTPSPSLTQATVPVYNQQYAPRPSASPAPLLQHHNSYGSQSSNLQTNSAQSPAVYQAQQQYANQYSTPSTPVAVGSMGNYNSQYQNATPAARTVIQTSTSHNSHTQAYNPPKPIEVYTLSDTANAAIPADIRNQFHRDEMGRVIFYTAPPLDANPLPEEQQDLGHSLQYLADKARNKDTDEKKRKEHSLQLEAEASERLKRIKTDAEGKKQWLVDQKVTALESWCAGMDRGTDKLYKQMHRDDWKEVREMDVNRLAVLQAEAFAKKKELEDFRKETLAKKDVKITGFKWI